MARKIPISFFAPAERESLEVVHRQAKSFNHTPLSRTLADETENFVFLLNGRRQIVMASNNVRELVTDMTADKVIGLRPGEALGCIHAHACESGCGTSTFCRQCMVVRVILKGLDGFRDMQECRLTRLVKGREDNLHLRVSATPISHDNDRFTLLAISRISPKRIWSNHSWPLAKASLARSTIGWLMH